MRTEKAFKELLERKDVLLKTGITLCERSRYRLYFKDKTNYNARKPKVETMVKYLTKYGAKCTPESWLI